MAYMLLIVEPIGQRATRTEAEGRAAYDAMVAYGERLRERGLLVATESLRSQQDASRVQVRNGKPVVIDGPFAETKEMIGGFFLLTCKTRDEALAVAAECPAATWCTVEVREVAPCYE
ncbi:MAG: YciI family protein [Burkholderiales bacterium]|nr:YciI family protein [Burkholderiales bacterium]